MYKILIFACSLLFTSISFAGLWPVITDITVDHYGTTDYNYYIKQKLLDVGPSVDVIIPNKALQLNHRHNPTTDDIAGAPTAETHTSNSQTISETVVDFYNSTGSKITYVHHLGSAPINECVAYIINPHYGDSRTPWSQVLVPGGCLAVPPADEWCKITTPELVLEHGTIALKQAEGSTSTAELGVQCTVPTAVTFSLVNDDKYIYLDEGKSEISVDNMPLKSKIDLPEGDSSLPVKDLITGVTKEGYHTGSSVLVMMPY
ncbi:hypothetical protein SNQ23_000788 [Cronobacter dublinensis]|nr:hypothetical protein [Cronobacter dublinensis]EMD9246443.1 hypothetical protein [Cronobacter dublinensis]